MDIRIVSTLCVSDMEGAAYLCLRTAAMSDIRNPHRHAHHERKRRFEGAQEILKKGCAFVTELGLSPEDCDWAAKQAHFAKDPLGWESRFRNAEYELQSQQPEPAVK